MTNWSPHVYGGPSSSGYEETLFAENGVYVTTARLVVGTVVYPIGRIAAVIPFYERAKRGVAFACFAFAAACFSFFYSYHFHHGFELSRLGDWLGDLGPGLSAAGIGTVAWITIKPKYGLRILMAGGVSIRAIVTSDQRFVERVHMALNAALARQ